MRVRQAILSDLEPVRQCLAAAFEPYRADYTEAAFRDTVLTPESAEQRFDTMTIFVAEIDAAEIVGTIAIEVSEPGTGHLRGMAVVPEHHATGVAAALLQSAEHELMSRGCTRVTLDTTAPLTRAIRFYRRSGYAPTGHTRDFFGMPLVEYEKRLAG